MPYKENTCAAPALLSVTLDLLIYDAPCSKIPFILLITAIREPAYTFIASQEMAIDTMQQSSQRDPLLERLGRIDYLLDYVEEEVEQRHDEAKNFGERASCAANLRQPFFLSALTQIWWQSTSRGREKGDFSFHGGRPSRPWMKTSPRSY